MSAVVVKSATLGRSKVRVKPPIGVRAFCFIKADQRTLPLARLSRGSCLVDGGWPLEKLDDD